MTLDDAKEKIEKARSIVILVHDNPDGDAIGAALAMKIALKQWNKKADVIIPEYPEEFKDLPGIEEIIAESEKKNYDLAIALDSGSTKQLHGYDEYFTTARNTLVIDHHYSNQMYGDLNYVDGNCPACCQLLIPIFKYFGIEIDKDMAANLLAGIITDTGGFRYEQVSADTFEFVAELIDLGVKISDLYSKVFATKSKSKFLLHQIAMNRYEFLFDGKVAYTYITKEDEKEVGAKEGDHNGIAELGRDVEGVEVSIFLRETGKNQIKGSLRSKSYVNVANLASLFGGGGHIRAAAFTQENTNIERVRDQLLMQLKGLLKENE